MWSIGNWRGQLRVGLRRMRSRFAPRHAPKGPSPRAWYARVDGPWHISKCLPARARAQCSHNGKCLRPQARSKQASAPSTRLQVSGAIGRPRASNRGRALTGGCRSAGRRRARAPAPTRSVRPLFRPRHAGVAGSEQGSAYRSGLPRDAQQGCKQPKSSGRSTAQGRRRGPRQVCDSPRQGAHGGGLSRLNRLTAVQGSWLGPR